MLESVVRVVVSLAVVLGLFWLVARAGSRKLGGGDRGLLRVRGRQSLSRGSSLAVVEVGSRVLVVGVSDSGVRLLTEMDPAELAPAAARETAESFEAVYEAASREQAVTIPALPTSEPAARRGAHRRTSARPSTGGPLAGSLLAPSTWRQAFGSATGRSVRTHERGAA